MIMKRSSHSICYTNNKLYVVGGFTDDLKVLKAAEYYDI